MYRILPSSLSLSRSPIVSSMGRSVARWSWYRSTWSVPMSRRLLFSASWMCSVEWSSPETLVAMNSSSRRPFTDLPMMASAFMYPSAVSMNVRPASIAACMVEMACDSSYPP